MVAVSYRKLNASLNRSLIFKTFQTFTIDVTFDSLQHISNPYFSLHFEESYGFPVFQPDRFRNVKIQNSHLVQNFSGYRTSYKAPDNSIIELIYDRRNIENREKGLIFALFRNYFHFSIGEFSENLQGGTVFHAL